MKLYAKSPSIILLNIQSMNALTLSYIVTYHHRMVGVGRHLCASSPTHLLKQGRLEQVAQDLVHTGVEYLQRRRIHNLSGQPVPGLRHPQREEVLPHV